MTIGSYYIGINGQFLHLYGLSVYYHIACHFSVGLTVAPHPQTKETNYHSSSRFLFDFLFA